MAKKNWIFVKRGLSEDPKHRERMGECIWLFLHLIDRADWETGIAYDWRDKDEAAEMAMPMPTMRHQRQKLQELGYITCKQGIHKQDIIIHNWTNPRNYSGDVINKKDDNSHGDNALLPYGDNHGDNHANSQVITLPIQSSSSSLGEKPSPTIPVESLSIENQIAVGVKAVTNPHYDEWWTSKRDIALMQICNHGADLEPLAAATIDALKVIPAKREVKGWAQVLRELIRAGVDAQIIRQAADKLRRDGMTIADPYSLRKTAMALVVSANNPTINYNTSADAWKL